MVSNQLKVLFIADGSLDRPILHSQGLPLFRQMSEEGIKCWILSFEISKGVRSSPLGDDLAKRGITWLPVRLLSENSKLARGWVIASGFWQAYKLCLKEKIDIIHCRSYRPAVIGSLLKALLGSGFVFDMRGFLIDEQIMLGRWQSKGIKYQFARLMERWCLLSADIIITNTSKFSQRVSELPYIEGSRQRDRIVSITNCVDTQRFKVQPIVRESYRKRLNWEGRTVFIFSGEVRRWEDFTNLIRFFNLVKLKQPSAFLTFIVYGDLNPLKREINLANLQSSDYCLMTAAPEEMPAFLSAADVGLLFRNPDPFTQEIHTPIKFAEYLASELPVIVTPGIGDTAQIIEYYKAGLIVNPADTEELCRGVEKIMEMLSNAPALRERCRRAAEQEMSLEFSVNEYRRVYDRVVSNKSIHMER